MASHVDHEYQVLWSCRSDHGGDGSKINTNKCRAAFEQSVLHLVVLSNHLRVSFGTHSGLAHFAIISLRQARCRLLVLTRGRNLHQREHLSYICGDTH